MAGNLTYKASEFFEGVTSVIFPNVCICCGMETTEKDRQICSFCKEERFEIANPNYKVSSSGVILPNIVTIQHALWQFDKGEVLQDLMHYLKYERLTGIGVELGIMLAQSMLKHPQILSLVRNSGQVMLVPVPLHYLKFRKRGFNQAFAIAQGVQQLLNTPICGLKSVVRRKNTRSQTGFSIKKRISNISGAFKVRDAGAFKDKVLIVVDDVFTTGATTFELTAILKDAGCREIIIATAAQA